MANANSQLALLVFAVAFALVTAQTTGFPKAHLSATPQPVVGPTFYVGTPSTIGLPDGSYDRPYGDLKTAVLALPYPAGGSITIKNGNYQFNYNQAWNPGRHLKVSAETRYGVNITMGYQFPLLWATTSHVMVIEGIIFNYQPDGVPAVKNLYGDLWVSNCKFISSGLWTESTDSSIYGPRTRVVNTVFENANNAVYIGRKATTWVENCRFDNNRQGGVYRASAVNIQGTLNNATLVNNAFRRNQRAFHAEEGLVHLVGNSFFNDLDATRKVFSCGPNVNWGAYTGNGFCGFLSRDPVDCPGKEVKGVDVYDQCQVCLGNERNRDCNKQCWADNPAANCPTPKTIYVSPTQLGDATPDGSRERPFVGMPSIGPNTNYGDTVILLPGTFIVNQTTELPDKKLTITTLTKDPWYDGVIFDCNYVPGLSGGLPVFRTRGASIATTLEGFIVQNCVYGVAVSDQNGVTVRNVIFRNMLYYTVYFSNGQADIDNILVLNSKSYYASVASYAGTSIARIRNSVFSGITSYNIRGSVVGFNGVNQLGYLNFQNNIVTGITASNSNGGIVMDTRDYSIYVGGNKFFNALSGNGEATVHCTTLPETSWAVSDNNLVCGQTSSPLVRCGGTTSTASIINPTPNVVDDCGVCGGQGLYRDCNGTCFGVQKTDGFGGCCFNQQKDCLGRCRGDATKDVNGVCCAASSKNKCGICFAPSCAQGTCGANGQCICDSTKYTGAECNTPVCTLPCKNGGECTAPNVCTCDPSMGYTGLTCEASPCGNLTCDHGGVCNSEVGTCDCSTATPGYSGEECKDFTCSVPCAHGTCVGPDVCACSTGWSGTYCSQLIYTGGNSGSVLTTTGGASPPADENQSSSSDVSTLQFSVATLLLMVFLSL